MKKAKRPTPKSPYGGTDQFRHHKSTVGKPAKPAVAKKKSLGKIIRRKGSK
jgi:hypothetical protein